MILTLRDNENVRNLLGLGRIRQEDGTRDTFERLFQSISGDDKVIIVEEFIDYFDSLDAEDLRQKIFGFSTSRTRVTKEKTSSNKVQKKRLEERKRQLLSVNGEENEKEAERQRQEAERREAEDKRYSNYPSEFAKVQTF